MPKSTIKSALFVCLGFAACSAEPGQPNWDRENAGLTSPLDSRQLQDGIRASLELIVTADTRTVWAGRQSSEALHSGGCPDIRGGRPSEVDTPGAQGGGQHWQDSCEAGPNNWSGYVYWEESGDERGVWGDALVGTSDTVAFEFDGDARDTFEQTGSGWAYESTVFGTVSGSSFFAADSTTPGGWRADMWVAYEQGAERSFEAEGDLLLFDDLFEGNFDSVAVALRFEPDETGDDACALEPSGTLSFRDADANWYDVVFEPRYQSNLDYENAPYSVCDGCGTVYFNGFEHPRDLCMDFDFLWDDLLTQPL